MITSVPVWFSFSSFLCSAALNAGQVGLALSYAITLMGTFQWGVRQSAEVENLVMFISAFPPLSSFLWLRHEALRVGFFLINWGHYYLSKQLGHHLQCVKKNSLFQGLICLTDFWMSIEMNCAQCLSLSIHYKGGFITALYSRDCLVAA